MCTFLTGFASLTHLYTKRSYCNLKKNVTSCHLKYYTWIKCEWISCFFYCEEEEKRTKKEQFQCVTSDLLHRGSRPCWPFAKNWDDNWCFTFCLHILSISRHVPPLQNHLWHNDSDLRTLRMRSFHTMQQHHHLWSDYNRS